MQNCVLIINFARNLFISLPRVELIESLFSKTGLMLKSNLILKLGLILKSNPILKLGFILKSNLILKLAFILKINLILNLSFILKFVHIQNFVFILNILEYPKPSISSSKQPGRLAACYLVLCCAMFVDHMHF